MEDQIAKDKAKMAEWIRTDQEAGQAMIDMDKDLFSLILQDRPSDAFIRSWHRNLPDIVFNPFWNESPDFVVTQASDKIRQLHSPHGDLLLRSVLDCLKQNILPSISENFINEINHQPFCGITNNAILSFQTRLKSYHDRRWYSRGLLKANGYEIKEQETPVYLCYWSFALGKKPISFGEAFERVDHNEAAAKEICCIGKIYAVYNAEQIIGISSRKEESFFSLTDDEKAKKCEHIIGGMGVSLAYEPGEAKYDHKKDCISMPPHTFSVEQHYATLIKLACYATAHEERLDRHLIKWQEDLCCELAQRTLCSRIQLDSVDITSSRMQEWAKHLTVDKNAFFGVAQEVKRIIDYLSELCPDDLDTDLSNYDFSQSLQDRINKAKERR